MLRHFALITILALAALAGCATAPSLIERDPVDGLIAQNAASATQALRELSEAAGNSRLVVATKASPKPLEQSPAATPQNLPQAIQERGQAATSDARPPANSIASRRGSIAVEIESRMSTTFIPSSSGTVASGGLLSTAPTGLDRLITVRWTGELEELLTRVAQESGWKLGDRTGLRVAPVIISINVENRSSFDVLRDIGAIAGTSADILVSASTRTISVRYPQR